MPSDSKPWWGRSTLLQLVIATGILLAGLGAAWSFAPGELRLLTTYGSIGYLVVMGAWATRRVARALTVVLEERSTGTVTGAQAAGQVLEATMLPLYCAVLLLLTSISTSSLRHGPQGSFLGEWFGTLSILGNGVLGLFASAIMILSIWRRRNRAGWIAVTGAQLAGAATAAAGFFLSLSGMLPAQQEDTWYSLSSDPATLWLVFQAICILLGLLAVIRLWHLIERDGRVPWATLLFLAVFIGYLAGFGRLTGFWLSSWLYGAFMMARLLTYAVFLFEPKDRPVWRSGWFACLLAAVVMCIAATIHTMTSGNFAMLMQPLLMMPLPPIGMSGSPWGFGPSLLLTLIRDMLLLLWFARWRAGWGEVLGVVVLVLLYGPLAIGLAILGWGFLFPVLYPLFIAGLVDAIWPLGMIGVLVALNLRLRRDLPATTSLA